MKPFSLFTLVLVAALAGCDAGIAGSSSATPTGAANSTAAPAVCQKSGDALCSDAAAASAEAPASADCPNGKCDVPGDCGLPQCPPTPECDQVKKCDGTAKKSCSPPAAPAADPKVGN